MKGKQGVRGPLWGIWYSTKEPGVGRGHYAGEAGLSRDSNAESWAAHTAVGRAGHLSLIYVFRGSDAASPVLDFGIHEANETQVPGSSDAQGTSSA